MSHSTAFDIETGPLPEAVIRDLAKPFEPPPEPGPFDPDAVKLGNAKKPETIQKTIDAARVKHEQMLREWPLIVKDQEKAYYDQLMEDLCAKAKNAHLMRVVGIGIGNHLDVLDDYADVFDEESYGCQNVAERQMLTEFWDHADAYYEMGQRLIGFNIFDYDLPVLIRRSHILGVKNVPEWVIDKNRFFNPTFVDLLEVWRCGNRQDYISLDVLGRSLGCGGKLDGVGGADFAKLLATGDEADRQQAEAYLARDLDLTLAVAERMDLHGLWS